MLNGDGNENGIKINRSNQQKNKLHVQHTFSSNQQKTNLHVQHAFLSFPCRCFARLQRCFVRLKRQTSQLHIIFMEELSYVLTKDFVSCVHVRFCFFTAAHFHLAGRQHFSFSHRRSDLRKTWSVIKQIISKKKSEQHFSNMKDSTGVCSDPSRIASNFNNFFANIGPSLASKLLLINNFLLRAHPLSPFFLSIIFFHFTLSINSMLLVLYSHILIAFYLLLFPRSFILILNITII